MNHNLRVNKTNFHMKGFALGLALKQRRKATQKSAIIIIIVIIIIIIIIIISSCMSIGSPS